MNPNNANTVETDNQAERQAALDALVPRNRQGGVIGPQTTLTIGGGQWRVKSFGTHGFHVEAMPGTSLVIAGKGRHRVAIIQTPEPGEIEQAAEPIT